MTSPPAPDPTALAVDRLTDRLMAAPPLRAAGGERVVGLSLSPAALKAMAAPLIKNVLSLAVSLGGTTVEDIAVAQADLIDDFVPDEVFRLIERIAHRLQPDHPHPVAPRPFVEGG